MAILFKKSLITPVSIKAMDLPNKTPILRMAALLTSVP